MQTEENFSPDIVFTIFGPAYFRARTTHVVGFAIPDMIYEPHARMPHKIRALNLILDRLRCRQFRKADHLVVETETVRQRLAQRLGIGDQQIWVIGNSLNPLLAKHKPVKPPVDGKFRLLIPSTYYPHKNLEIVPPLAHELQRLNPDFDFEFRFTLDATSAPWQRIKSTAKALGVADRFKTLGSLLMNNLATSYQATSAVFLPTLREASTAVYPESFYFQRPLITSDTDFARELCGKAAVYIPPFDPQSIAAKINELASSPELIDRLVAAGNHQLASRYPDPDQKFKRQLELLMRATDVTLDSLVKAT